YPAPRSGSANAVDALALIDGPPERFEAHARAEIASKAPLRWGLGGLSALLWLIVGARLVLGLLALKRQLTAPPRANDRNGHSSGN
ncbi:hypothetical protein OAX78_02005, partial [Planctomycetota bacterium]|nr:hypothetical protein [Planctomycetota bacterium]